MFINCPYCKALVATDPASDLPPPHCPHCDNLLRRDPHAPDDDEVAPLDLGALMDPTAIAAAEARAIAQAEADAEADAWARAAMATHANRSTNAAPSHASPAGIDLLADTVVADAPADMPEEPGIDTTTVGATAAIAPAAIAPTVKQRRLPSFARTQDGMPRPARERWLIIAVAALVVLLVLQLLLADRARLAANAQWRPLLAGLCTALRCDLPPWREPAAFTLLQRDVRQHPSIAGALRVTATFRNDARWSQPWPYLQLTLSDANGRQAGQRRFDAREYLGGEPGQAELASGESATVAMDILEPAPQIVAYDFLFR